MLLHQPVGADMILFQPEYDNIDSVIYFAIFFLMDDLVMDMTMLIIVLASPIICSWMMFTKDPNQMSCNAGLHVVLVLALVKIKGKWVDLVNLV